MRPKGGGFAVYRVNLGGFLRRSTGPRLENARCHHRTKDQCALARGRGPPPPWLSASKTPREMERANQFSCIMRFSPDLLRLVAASFL